RGFAQGIERRSGEARVEPACGRISIGLQVLLELAPVDAQVGLLDVGNRQPRVLMELLRDLVPPGWAQMRAFAERNQIFAQRKVLDLLEKRLKLRRIAGQAMMIPGRRRI